MAASLHLAAPAARAPRPASLPSGQTCQHKPRAPAVSRQTAPQCWSTPRQRLVSSSASSPSAAQATGSINARAATGSEAAATAAAACASLEVDHSSSDAQQQAATPPQEALQQYSAAPASARASSSSSSLEEQPPEGGQPPVATLAAASGVGETPATAPLPSAVVPVEAAQAATEAAGAAVASAGAGVLGMPDPSAERNTDFRDPWSSLMRWSRYFRSRETNDALDRLEKVVVFGGGSFGTAMAVTLARQKSELQVTLLLRDPYLCKDINELHCNTRYLKDFTLPPNVSATTSPREAILGAQFAIHAVPVQHTRVFLEGIKELMPPSLPIISVSKGIEVSTGQLMSEVVPSVLGKKQRTVYISGPSFANEVMSGRLTCVVAASRDKSLARTVQRLFASPAMRVNTTTDVIGVEICGSLKNVLAIAAGIVEGLELGPNAMAALVSQGCAEIRWLATKMGGKTATISGLSGLGDIMLTCYGSLSRNRTVGVRLGRGEKLSDILASSSQVAEGVATAEVVVNLAHKYRVQMPVLTAVAQVVDGHLTARQAVFEIMNLPQIEER
ncbi:hypothetical protein D9Q98_007366 [Chlorella vulgaris]|uniref:Glycerol-3-phosphate dehydrogenase [NAD(+)] n=1 Tax=Chlorella vulgaris TaxID=3077 RepID=A0A9D4TL32_CHLVU|nr:hypothetical protein D9Q98_007366 [Chlorella vulgaris]